MYSTVSQPLDRTSFCAQATAAPMAARAWGLFFQQVLRVMDAPMARMSSTLAWARRSASSRPISCSRYNTVLPTPLQASRDFVWASVNGMGEFLA